MVEEDLEQSLVLIDLCDSMQENLAYLKITIQELQLPSIPKRLSLLTFTSTLNICLIKKIKVMKKSNIILKLNELSKLM
jgi:hypothetical protein